MKLIHDFCHAPLYRRLGAILYDLLLILALVLIATVCWILLFNRGEAISIGNRYYQLFLLFLFCFYYLWFWTKSGQTTGMAAWRIKLVAKTSNQRIADNRNNKNFQNKMDNQKIMPITVRQAFIRGLIAIPLLLFGGIGILYCCFNKNRSSLYDRIAGTELIRC